MSYLYEALEKPTRLYIKQCPHCGLKYFGKSTREDIEKYPGSGTRWSRHLNKHEIGPIHLWNSDWYYDTSIIKFAMKFSKINKIVESKLWANLIPENGLDGGWDYVNSSGKNILIQEQWSKNPHLKEKSGTLGKSKFLDLIEHEEYKDKFISKIKTGINAHYASGGVSGFYGKKHTEETKKKMKVSKNSGSDNPNHNKIWITDGIISKMVANTEIPEGWYKGRKIK